MKNLKHPVTIGIVLGITTSLLLIQSHAKAEAGGTSILHLAIRETMANTAVNTNAAGRVDAKQNKQGRSNVQRLDISASNLGPNAPYQLLALLGDDTNSTAVANFTSDADGQIDLRYRRVDAGNGNGNGHAKGLGKGKSALPNVLNPISNIRGLHIQDAANQVVLTADFTAPDKFGYLVKRPLTNDGFDADAAGTLRIKGNLNQANLRVVASNLETNADYFLILNGSINETNTTDSTGKLTVTTALLSPVDILGLRTLSISDSASNSILSTQLP